MARETAMTAPGQSSSSNHENPGATAFRAMIYAQILWIVIVGLASRGVIPFPLEPRWLEKTFELAIGLALFIFPLLVIACLLYWQPPEWKFWMLLLAQAGLTAAYLIALLPMVQ